MTDRKSKMMDLCSTEELFELLHLNDLVLMRGGDGQLQPELRNAWGEIVGHVSHRPGGSWLVQILDPYRHEVRSIRWWLGLQQPEQPAFPDPPPTEEIDEEHELPLSRPLSLLAALFRRRVQAT